MFETYTVEFADGNIAMKSRFVWVFPLLSAVESLFITSLQEGFKSLQAWFQNQK